MGYDVDIAQLPITALFDLKGSAKAISGWAPGAFPKFARRPNRLTHGDAGTLCHIGPDHWILRADLDREGDLEAALRPAAAPAQISIVRISDTMAFFRIAGADAGEVMSIGCPMDLHPAVFPKDGVSFTEFFGVRALVMRAQGGFDLGVEQSFAPMIADYLRRATT